MKELASRIMQLELKLLHSDWRANPSGIDELLDQTFEEISSSGRVSARQDVVTWLLNKDPHQKWALKEFRIKRLSDDMVIASYCAVKDDQMEKDNIDSIRSSVWQRYGDHWKMVYHQATKRV